MSNSGRTLGLDLGSSSVRATVLDEELDTVGMARKPVTVSYSRQGAAEIEPEEFASAVESCIDTLRDAGQLDGVCDVASASQWHSILAVDGAGRPRTRAVIWADTRPRGEVMSVPSDPEEFHRRTGCWHDAPYWSARIPWLQATLGLASVSFIGLPDFVAGRLLEETCCSVSMASGTGLLDLRERRWDDEALSLATVDASRLPPLCPSGWTGVLSASSRQRWPQLAKARWHAAVGDGAASNIGAGCVDTTRIAVTIGTSAAVRVVHRSEAAVDVPHELWRYLVDDERAVTGRAFSGAGNLFSWARSTLGEEVVEELSGFAPGSGRLLALPFQAGSRPPEALPGGFGVISGLGLDTSRGEICAAMLEGVCHEVAGGVAALEDAFDVRAEIVLNGGAVSGSPWWQRACAAALGRSLRVCAEPEVATRGAALLARGAVIGADPPLEVVAPVADEVERMTGAARRYAALRERLGEGLVSP